MLRGMSPPPMPSSVNGGRLAVLKVNIPPLMFSLVNGTFVTVGDDVDADDVVPLPGPLVESVVCTLMLVSGIVVPTVLKVFCAWVVVLTVSFSGEVGVYSVLRIVAVLPCSVAVAVSVEWPPVCVSSLCVDTGNESVVGLEKLVVPEDSVTVISLGLLEGKVDDP